MSKLKVNQYQVGPVCTNCYFAINTETKEVLLIDPGDGAEYLIEMVEKESLKPVAVLLTHGHFDHATAAEEVAKHFGISVYAHEKEKETLLDPRLNLSGSMGGKSLVYHADCFVKDEEMLDLAGFSIRVLYTPGHTVGGCCYYFIKENVVFSGDSLFCGSIGRTEFPKGSMSDLVRSVKDKLLVLPDYVKVYPGHDMETTIEQEKTYNPYF